MNRIQIFLINFSFREIMKPKLDHFLQMKLFAFSKVHQIYHLESNGEALVIFDKIKLARTDENDSIY